ncbi:hypothetical protein ACFPMF_01240 [Larkinella bovis]|uniref:DUF3244 domain-containing protein n=1 Tax=Larkinella bovis TaxID=683041 RepID=A0ABW0I532_9BACT
MKTVSPFTQGRFCFMLFAGLLLAGFSAHSQPDYYTKTDSSQAYWKVQTDFTSQQTVIRFFNRHREPIYQETLAGRYVKLTDRNIRLFDEMLHRLLTNQLLSAEVRSHDLLASGSVLPYYVASAPLSTPVTPVATSYIRTSTKESFETNPLRSDVGISNTGKLRLLVMNLLEKPVLVTLIDDAGRHIFKEKETQLSYNRTLNLTQLPAGKFRLDISGSQRDYAYRVIIGENPRTYEIRAIR